MYVRTHHGCYPSEFLKSRVGRSVDRERWGWVGVRDSSSWPEFSLLFSLATLYPYWITLVATAASVTVFLCALYSFYSTVVCERSHVPAIFPMYVYEHRYVHTSGYVRFHSSTDVGMFHCTHTYIYISLIVRVIESELVYSCVYLATPSVFLCIYVYSRFLIVLTVVQELNDLAKRVPNHPWDKSVESREKKRAPWRQNETRCACLAKNECLHPPASLGAFSSYTCIIARTIVIVS